MKRSAFIKLILIFCIAVGMLLMAVSCDNASKNTNDDTTTSTNAPVEETTTAPEVTSTLGFTPETTVLDTNRTYKVTVVDETGAPLAGATVQLCVGEICRLPIATDANGVALIEAEAGEYAVKVTLSGYTGEAQYSFPEDSTELTVTLTANS